MTVFLIGAYAKYNWPYVWVSLQPARRETQTAHAVATALVAGTWDNTQTTCACSLQQQELGH